jgi:hypothetical protein
MLNSLVFIPWKKWAVSWYRRLAWETFYTRQSIQSGRVHETTPRDTSRHETLALGFTSCQNALQSAQVILH